MKRQIKQCPDSLPPHPAHKFMCGVSAGRAYIGLGSNLGNKRNNLLKAIRRLNQLAGTRVLKQSSFYNTAPVGIINQPDFLNAVVLIETTLRPTRLLKQLFTIETDLGRPTLTRTGKCGGEKWGPRIIDLDILFYNNSIIRSPNLIVPHPWLHQRRFVLEPLAEIAPDLVHPVLKQTAHSLLKRCKH